MNEENSSSTHQRTHPDQDKKPATRLIVTGVILFTCMLFALVVVLRGQLNQGYVQERYPVEELEQRLKQKRPQI